VTWQLSITGLLIGLLVGATGMGGGALMTPLLIFLFGFKPTLAVGTDILHGAVFKTFGAVRHRRLGTVHAHLTLWMFMTSAPFSLVGVQLAEWIENRIRRLGRVGLGEGDRGGARPRRARLPRQDLSEARRAAERRAVPAAAARPGHRALPRAGGGFIVGLTSVGSGTFFALVMLLVFPLTAVKIVGTDIFHAAALLWVAGFSYLLHGNVDLGAMSWLLLGSIPGVLIGSQITVRLPERELRIALATVLLASGVKLLEPPATGTLLVLVSLVGIALLGISAGRRLTERAGERPVAYGRVAR
jgi:uncharacterized protein